MIVHFVGFDGLCCGLLFCGLEFTRLRACAGVVCRACEGIVLEIRIPTGHHRKDCVLVPASVSQATWTTIATSMSVFTRFCRGCVLSINTKMCIHVCHEDAQRNLHHSRWISTHAYSLLDSARAATKTMRG